MPIDPVGGTLGAIAIFFPLYDSCKRLYEGCKGMSTFGRDFRLLWRRLEVQLAILELVMKLDRRKLERPPDPDDRNHEVTRIILGQLEILETYFGKCRELVQSAFKDDIVGGRNVPNEDDLPSLTTTSSSTTAGEASSSTQSSKKSQKPSKSLLKKFVRMKRDGAADVQVPQIGNVERMDLPQISALPSIPSGNSISSRDAVSRQLKDIVGFRSRVKWVDHAKAEFRFYLKEIERANDALEKITKLNDSKDTSALIRRRNKSQHQPDWFGRRALKLLHYAMGAVNNDMTSPRVLSLSISDQFKENRKNLEEIIDEERIWAQLDVLSPSLRAGSIVFWLLMRSSNDESKSGFAMVESGIYETADKPLDQIITDISELGPKPTDPNDGQYLAIGEIIGRKESQERHRVFRERGLWSRNFVLEDLVLNTSLGARLDVEIVAKLARNVLTAFWNLTDVRPQMQFLGLRNFEYFRPPMQQDDQDIDMSIPYLACGFGQRPPLRRPGMRSGPLKNPNHGVLELGLILYQLGTWTCLDVSPESLEANRQKALESILDVEKSIGTVYADVVAALLQSDNSNEEDVVYAGIVALEDFVVSLGKREIRLHASKKTPAIQQDPQATQESPASLSLRASHSVEKNLVVREAVIASVDQALETAS